jgi:hypothetical protein
MNNSSSSTIPDDLDLYLRFDRVDADAVCAFVLHCQGSDVTENLGV